MKIESLTESFEFPSDNPNKINKIFKKCLNGQIIQTGTHLRVETPQQQLGIDGGSDFVSDGIKGAFGWERCGNLSSGSEAIVRRMASILRPAELSLKHLGQLPN